MWYNYGWYLCCCEFLNEIIDGELLYVCVEYWSKFIMIIKVICCERKR